MKRFYFTVGAVALILAGGLAAIVFAIEEQKCFGRFPNTVYAVRWTVFGGCEINLTHGHWLPADSVKVYR